MTINIKNWKNEIIAYMEIQEIKIIYRIDIVSNSILLTAEMDFDKKLRIYWLYIPIEEGINLLIAWYCLTFEENFAILSH